MIETKKTTIVNSITTTIWNTQSSTTGRTTSPLKIEQNITQSPISTTISESSTETQMTSTNANFQLTADLSIEDISMIQLDETTTMSWFNKGKIFREK